MNKWRAEKIDDLFLVTDFVANGSFSALRKNVTYNYEKDYAVLVRTTDNTKGWNGKYVYVNKASYDFLGKSWLKPNDLIISNVGEPGKAFLCPDLGQPMTIGPNSILVRPLDNEIVNSKFFYYFTISRHGQGQIQEICSATTQKKFNKTSYRKLKIPLPPLDQQKQIAKILDAADAYRQKTKALIEKYDELTQSLFLDMFGDPVTNPKGWEQKILGNLLEITSSKRIFKDEYVDQGIPFYRTKEIVELSKGNDISLELFISEGRYAEIKSKYDLPAIGDILLSAVGTIGIMWTVDTNKPFYFKDGNLVWLKSSILNEVNPTYLRMTLEHLIEYEKFKLAEGGAYNALTIAKLKDFNVLLAPYKLQNQFAERIQTIEAQKMLAQQELEKTEELFNCLLQKAFKGELTI